MNHPRLLRFLTAAIVAIGSVASLSTAIADVVIGPKAVVGNTFGDFSENFPVENLINQSGLSLSYQNLVADFDSFNATHSADAVVGDWASDLNAVFPGVIDFDLGNEFLITQFGLWNDVQPLDDVRRGINLFSVFVDNNPGFSSPTLIGTFNAVDGGVGDSTPRQVFDVADAVCRFVRISVSSNHGGSILQIGEVSFGGITIPEPASLVLLGLGGAVWLVRRQQAS